MKWHKFISALLHPIVMPTIGMLLYFVLSPLNISYTQRYTLLCIVFIATYLIPALMLLLLKTIGHIKSYQVTSIEERKVPLFLMMLLFFLLGRAFYNIYIIRDISYLFYGTTLALSVVYIFFFAKIKISLHLLSMGISIGYFLILSFLYHIYMLPFVLIFTLLSGLLASSRLYLKAHTSKEVYLGFLIGIISELIIFSIL
ncbi:conserved membrane hypothetical protein [Tenacibaculum maritimum]|uniref:hypothetical protein n=1 Tax=Tenacibaculum maritimum TaxID=107401 RepID=UPI0012E4EF3A|nr:hypothetical protein [Tenacibaculum maritimum]CAA0246883.1 conserved membrane hypothetical protein [Tenacibaculum maritimum]